MAAGVRGVKGIWAGGVGVRVLVRRGGDGRERRGVEKRVAQQEETEGRSTPQGLPDGDAVVVERKSPEVGVLDEAKEEEAATEAVAKAVEESSRGHNDVEGDDGELIEVGRGLANYNSAQIEKVMGLNRCVYVLQPKITVPLLLHLFRIDK